MKKVNISGDEITRKYANLISRHGQRVSIIMYALFQGLSGRVNEKMVADLIAKGDIRKIAELVKVNGILIRGTPIVNHLLYQYVSMARDVSRMEDKSHNYTYPGPDGDFIIALDERNPEMVEAAQRITGQLVVEIDSKTETTIRNIVTEELNEGNNPYDAARKIKKHIGLTTYQRGLVNNARRELEEGRYGAYQRRRLRDKRNDPKINRATREEKRLDRAYVEKVIAKYEKNMIQYRSKVIGRTESIRAIQEARVEHYDKMIRDGKILESQIKNVWIPTRDHKLRDSHALIPSMNPDGRGHNEMFQSPLGPIRYPADPFADPANSIQCRCAIFTKIQPFV